MSRRDAHLGLAPDLFAKLVRRPIDDQAALFASDVLRQALSRALKDCPRSREEVAAELQRREIELTRIKPVRVRRP